LPQTPGRDLIETLPWRYRGPIDRAAPRYALTKQGCAMLAALLESE
jgi:hypothetical protein